MKKRAFDLVSIGPGSRRRHLGAILGWLAGAAALALPAVARADCTDGAIDGDETDIDCGGSCGACPGGEMCDVDGDCQSELCLGGVCGVSPASCSDGAQDGDETAVDCGGSCPGCVGGQACTTGHDCQSGLCQGGLCVPRTMADIVEVQLDTTSQSVRDMVSIAGRNLRDSLLCGLQPFSCLGGGGPDDLCVIDHIVIPDPGTSLSLRFDPISAPFHNITINPVQAVLPVQLFLQQEACLTDPTATCPPPTENEVDLMLTLSAGVDSAGGIQLCGQLAQALEIQTGGGVSNLVPYLPPQATQKSCVSLNQLTGVLAAIGTNLADVEVSADAATTPTPGVITTAGTRIGVRVWLAANPTNDGNLLVAEDTIPNGVSDDDYASFFAGMLAPTAPGTDWSVFFGSDLLNGLLQQVGLDEGQTLAQNQGYPFGADLSTPNGAAWLPCTAPSGSSCSPGTLLSVSASIENAPPASCNANATVQASGFFSLDTVHQQLLFNGQGIISDVSLSGPGICDLVSNATATGDANLALLAPFLFKPFAGAKCTGTVLGAPPVFVGGEGIACSFPSASPLVQLVPNAPPVQATITQLFGPQNGLVLGGTLTSNPIAADSLASISTAGIGYTWDQSCDTQGFQWQGSIDVLGVGIYCGTQVLGEAQSVYYVQDPDPGNPSLPKTLNILTLPGSPALVPPLSTPPVPFIADVFTTGGVAQVTAGVGSPPDFDALLSEKGQIASICNYEPGGASEIGLYAPIWLVDPPPDPAATLTLAGGGVLTATVSVTSVAFQSLGPAAVTQTGDLSVEVHKHPVRVTGTAVIQPAGQAAFTATFSVPFTADFSGETENGVSPGLVALSPLEALSAEVQIPASALPSGFTGASFALDVAAGSVTLIGTLPPAPVLDPSCPQGPGQTAYNPGSPSREVATCAQGEGFSLTDAFAACGGDVSYYSYTCSDFPASLPYQPDDERTWVAYYGCCTGPS